MTRAWTASADTPTETIYCDDNRLRLASLPAESVDLIYLDPPFFSNRHYEVIWGDEAEVRSFGDRWEGGIQVYVNWMRDRVVELHRILKPNGNMYLHCDWHAGHYLKVMVDDVFGARNFLNEIVWCYETGGRAKKHFPRKHDTILRYGKTKRAAFYYDQVALPRDFSTMHETVQVDETGRRYQRNIKGGKEYRYYEDQGVLPNDWWTDIQLNPAAKERLGYPTQKPEALLDRIINASSKPGDVVLDPFCGCGTTIVCAERLKRRWIGIDISPTAVNIMKRRMDKIGATGIRLVNLPTTADQLRQLKPYEFQNWVIQRFNGTHSPRKTADMGIDGRSFFNHYPIQVKQSEHVGRNVVDNFETAIERDGRDAGYIVAFSFTRGAYEERARAKAQKGLTIQLVTVAELLESVPDLAIANMAQLIDLPLPPPRPVEAMPSLDELVVSGRSA